MVKGNEYTARNEGYFLDGSTLLCSFCQTNVVWENRKKHTNSKLHDTNKKLKAESNEQDQQLISQVKTWKRDKQVVGQSLSAEMQLYRLKVLQLMCRGKIALNVLKDITPLLDDIPFLRPQHLAMIQDVLHASFKEFGLTVDASPHFAEA